MRTKQVFGRMGSRSPLYVGILGLLLATAPAKAQDAAPPQGAGQMQRPDEGRGRGVAGKITSLKDGALELTRMDGATVTVKLTDKSLGRVASEFGPLPDRATIPYLTEPWYC